MVSALFNFVLVLAFLACDGGSEAAPAPELPPETFEVRVTQGDSEASVTVEIAATSGQRQQGLMHRKEMDEDAGMLFLFPSDLRGGFWMRNTYIPLDIAYIGADGKVQEIRAAKPLDDTNLVPAQSYRYVLEVNQGWFERHALGVGAMVELPEGLPPAQ